MDIILGTVVVAAVIFFGALISVGNERQRKALDGIRRQAENWAMEDLRLKRGKIGKEVEIVNAYAWLSEATSKALGEAVSLTAQDVYTNPTAIAYHDGLNGRRLVYSLTPPQKVRKLARRRKSALSAAASHPLFGWKRGEVVELNMLNGGLLFDVELPVAWKMLTGEVTDSERLWLYVMQ